MVEGRPRRIILLGMLLTFSLALGVGLLEAGLRVVLMLSGKTHSSDEISAIWRSELSALRSNSPNSGDADDRRTTVAHPYLGFSYNRDGVPILSGPHWRSPTQLPLEIPRDAFVVLVVGGSVATNFCTKGGAEVLVDALASHPRLASRPVILFNGAHGAYKAPQQLMVVAYAVALGLRPNAILNIDGFNEVTLARTNLWAGLPGDYPWHYHWLHNTNDLAADRRGLAFAGRIALARDERAHLLLRAVGGGWHQSAVLATLVRSRLARLLTHQTQEEAAYRDHLAARSSGIAGLPQRSQREAVEELVELWARTSEFLADYSAGVGARYIHVLQPALSHGDKPRTGDEQKLIDLQRSWADSAAESYPALRARGARLAERGISFHDLSTLFDAEPSSRYVDVVHFNEAGRREFARAVAASVLEDW